MQHHTTISLLSAEKVLFPFQTLTICLSNKAEWQTVLSCQRRRQQFGLVMKKGMTLQNVGCLASIEKIPIARSNGTLDISVRGTQRFSIRHQEGIKAKVKFFRDRLTWQQAKLRLQTAETQELFFREWENSGLTSTKKSLITSMQPAILSFFIAGTSDFTLQEQQELLETRCIHRRLAMEAEILACNIDRQQKLSELSAWLPNVNELSQLLN